MFGLGPGELLVILVIGVIVLGPKRLPDAGRSLGRAMVEFRRAAAELRTAMSEPPSAPNPAPVPSVSASAATGGEAQAKPDEIASVTRRA